MFINTSVGIIFKLYYSILRVTKNVFIFFHFIQNQNVLFILVILITY